MAIEADNNGEALMSDSDPVYQIFDNLFCVYFLIEWFIRFMSFKYKSDGFRDFWFVFDGSLVVLMVIDTWAISVVAASMNDFKAGDTSIVKLVRLARLTRMARMGHLINACPELLVLVKGMAVAARSVFFTLWLLGIIIYVFAIGLRQLTDGTDVGTEYFGSVYQAMVTLLFEATLPDLNTFVTSVGRHHMGYAFVCMLYILLASLTVMNMLVGVLIEVVSVVSAVEKEQMQVNFVKSKLEEMMDVTGLDTDTDTKISRREFENLLLNPRAAKIIQDVGVDPVGLVDFTDHIFNESHGVDSDGLSLGKFIEVVMQLRGKNTSTVKDIVNLRKMIHKDLEDIFVLLNRQTNRLSELDSNIASEDHAEPVGMYASAHSFGTGNRPLVRSYSDAPKTKLNKLRESAMSFN